MGTKVEKECEGNEPRTKCGKPAPKKLTEVNSTTESEENNSPKGEH